MTESRDGSGASIELPLTGAGNNTTSRTAVIVLRDDLVPRTLGRVPGVQTAVTGDTASDIDLTNHAVRYAITRTAGVVTSAALVMVGVFSLFASLSSLDLKQAGVGLATAILIDATIVRAVLLPAAMTLLGGWNRYLPRWLEWLPGGQPELTTPHRKAHSPGSRPPALQAPALHGE